VIMLSPVWALGPGEAAGRRCPGCHHGVRLRADVVSRGCHGATRKVALEPDIAVPPACFGGRTVIRKVQGLASLGATHLLNAAGTLTQKAFARANQLDRVVFDSERHALGIVTSGKAYLDVREALRELQIDESRARALGIRLYKVGMVWPLDTDSAIAFGRGHEELLVVEEKRPIIEEQLTHAFYHVPASQRPRITGKTDDAGRPLKPAHGELSVNLAIEILARRIEALNLADASLKARIESLRLPRANVVQLPTAVLRSASEYAVNGASASGIGSPVAGSRSPTAWTAIVPVPAAPARGGEGRDSTRTERAAARAARESCDNIACS